MFNIVRYYVAIGTMRIGCDGRSYVILYPVRRFIGVTMVILIMLLLYCGV